MKDNINSHFYYHFISMAQEWKKIKKNNNFTNEEAEIMHAIENIIININYKNKDTIQILKECKLMEEGEEF